PNNAARRHSECRLQTELQTRDNAQALDCRRTAPRPGTRVLRLPASFSMVNAKLSLAMDYCAIPPAFLPQPEQLTFALGQAFHLQLCELSHSCRLRASDPAPIPDM